MRILGLSVRLSRLTPSTRGSTRRWFRSCMRSPGNGGRPRSWHRKPSSAPIALGRPSLVTTSRGRVTINLARSHLRRRITEAKAMALVALRQRTPLETQPENAEELWAEVRGLPRRQRESFVLHYVDGLSIGEIAEVLEVAETTVKTHLQRGREAVLRGLGVGRWES